MSDPASEIRCDNDLKLYQALLAHPKVRRVRDTIEKQEEKRKGPGVRRHLLSTSVRLSRSMSGPLHVMADRCQERLGIQSRLELYAYPAPQFNAVCFKPEDGRVFIMFSSSLLEAFSEQELLFVMGHELGHHVYRHHEIPIGYILRGKTRPSAALALDLFAWSRYAEVSADRAGAYCAEDLPSVARALFKLASGLRDDTVVQFDLDEFLRQVDDMLALGEQPGQGAPMQDWFLTHPFSPLRVKALTIFDCSVLMRSGGIDKHKLEDQVQTVMGLMEPDYLKGKTEATRAMRNLFVAGALAVADAAGGISDKERQTLEEFFEEGYALEKLDPERLRELLPKRIEAAREKASLSQRMQVVRDLCLVAGVEHPVAQAESKLLEEIAQALDIPTGFVSQCLEASPELD
ncbi:MAG: M48 family metallopeptidase [Arenicellales bacterium]|nr:M48 family metallopeptidase [Arenicellales bacterium]MDP6551762.1 M48 family metallopeptidase [Arenicellales bacterium]MDP6918076.1 M48 family metallopeptidase [Arenicellales bacterium]